MKGLVILAVVALLLFAGWSWSDCNNKNFISKYVSSYQSKFCTCPNQLVKSSGINESRCVSNHTDSLAPCSAYDHCTQPEQCVRLNGTAMACKYVQAGCYEYIGNDSTILQKCI